MWVGVPHLPQWDRFLGETRSVKPHIVGSMPTCPTNEVVPNIDIGICLQNIYNVSLILTYFSKGDLPELVMGQFAKLRRCKSCTSSNLVISAKIINKIFGILN